MNRSMITNTLKNLGDYIVLTAVDKRKSLLTLSAEGKALYTKMPRLISEAATATVEALSEEDLEALKNIVSKMKNGYVQP